MYILKDVDFSKLIYRNLNEKHTLLIEYLDENGKKQKKHWRNNGKDIYLEGIKEITKARVGYDKAWKNVLKTVNNMIVKKPQLDFDEVEEINMYSITSLNNETLKNIYKNIENFANLWKKYRNILFVCGDYPGYGGAATNCDRLQKFFKERGHNTFAFYYNNNKSPTEPIKGNDIWIEEKSQIKNIPFTPDLIVTKSFFNSLNLKDLFRVPVIYCVGGIFPNSLDKYFYDLGDKEIKNICNKNVIQQIKNSDFVFVNSSHTRDILKDTFNLHSHIFYSSFIQYYNKKSVPFIDNTFKVRKYEYGLIMSNFNRSIKNAKESIKFLKDKKNVILIGENSSQFKKYGFTCIELVKNVEMDKYYRQIKYIIQDSFYESCSNVRIESLFNGCKIYKKKLFIFSSTQLPQNGGAATNCLYLHEYVKNNLQYDSVAVFFTSDNDNPSIDYIRKDIYILGKEDKAYSKFKYQILRQYDEKNIICFCKNIVAPQKMRQIFPLSKVIYLVAGAPIHTYWAEFNTNISFVKYKKNFINREITKKDAIKTNRMNFFGRIMNERKAIQICDEILTNSNMTRDIILHNYKDYIFKLHNKNINTSNLKFDYPTISQQDFDKKDIDIIFAVTNHIRKGKGSEIMNKIITNNNMNNLTKVVIGDKFKEVFNVNKIKNCSFLNKLSQSELFSYLKRSKILIIPSIGDASPNILYEGLHLGCNILITKNCGNYELFPDISVLEDVDDIDLFIKHIYLLKEHPIDYNIQNDRKKFSNYLERFLDA
jgi:hypothetical protein